MLFSPFLQWTKYPKTVLLFYSGSMAKFYINTLTDIPTHQRFLKVNTTFTLSQIRALRRMRLPWSEHSEEESKNKLAVFCGTVFPLLFSPREKKGKGSVQNKSGILFKVTSGQDTLQFWQSCFRYQLL